MNHSLINHLGFMNQSQSQSPRLSDELTVSIIQAYEPLLSLNHPGFMNYSVSITQAILASIMLLFHTEHMLSDKSVPVWTGNTNRKLFHSIIPVCFLNTTPSRLQYPKKITLLYSSSPSFHESQYSLDPALGCQHKCTIEKNELNEQMLLKRNKYKVKFLF